MRDADPASSRVLLTVDHPKSARTLAWTRTYRDARVFAFQLGHDNQAWVNESFREVLGRGIGWAAGDR
jgi:type 1 glutamine amidotransferase